MPAASSGVALAPMARTPSPPRSERRPRRRRRLRRAVLRRAGAVFAHRAGALHRDRLARVHGRGRWLPRRRAHTPSSGATPVALYPAGFVYLYAALRRLTGGEVASAQIIFILVYVANLAAVLAVYVRARVVRPGRPNGLSACTASSSSASSTTASPLFAPPVLLIQSDGGLSALSRSPSASPSR